MDAAEAAPLLCAGVTVYNSMRNMPVHSGDLVAIQGIGGLGHLAVSSVTISVGLHFEMLKLVPSSATQLQYAAKMGFRVAALSSSDKKKEMATKLGAHEYIVGDDDKSQAQKLADLGGAQLIVATAPSAEIIKELISGLAVNGTLLILAITPDDLAIPSMPMIQKRLSVRGWPSGTAFDSEDTLQFAQVSGVKCQIERYPLDKAEEAYQSMMEGHVRFRAVLVPGLKKE